MDSDTLGAALFLLSFSLSSLFSSFNLSRKLHHFKNLTTNTDNNTDNSIGGNQCEFIGV